MWVRVAEVATFRVDATAEVVRSRFPMSMNTRSGFARVAQTQTLVVFAIAPEMRPRVAIPPKSTRFRQSRDH